MQGGAVMGWSVANPLPLSANQLVPPATRGPAGVKPGSALGEKQEGVWSIPAACSYQPWVHQQRPAHQCPAWTGAPAPLL